MTHVSTELHQFIERSAELMEEHGFPRMAGRVIGALLISIPPQLSHDELAELLQASKGSISMSTQLLMRLNLVERVSLPGQRRSYYRLRENLWHDFLTDIAQHVQRERAVVLQGLAVLQNEPVETKRRLIEMLVISDFMQEEWPGLLDRWETRRHELLEARIAELSSPAGKG